MFLVYQMKSTRSMSGWHIARLINHSKRLQKELTEEAKQASPVNETAQEWSTELGRGGVCGAEFSDSSTEVH